MKIAVVGVGGVGGFLAAMMTKKGFEVTVVARGARGAHIEEKGLTLHSDSCGDFTVYPKVVRETSKLTGQDLIFVCVKNYSLREVLTDLSGAVGENTIVVPVLNGVDPGDVTREVLPEAIVCDSLIYTVSGANPDYSISHRMKNTKMYIGIMNADEREKEAVSFTVSVLCDSGVDTEASDDIRFEIWRKYVLNCAFNVATARHKTTIGPLRDDPKTAADYEALVREAAMVGRAQGVGMTKDIEDQIIDRFYHEHAYDAASSLQRDVIAGKPSELETFSGYIVKTAKKLSLKVPVSEAYYQGFLAMGVR